MLWRTRIIYLTGACGLVLTALMIAPLITAYSLGEAAAFDAFLLSFLLATLISGGMFVGFRTDDIAPQRAASIVLPVAAYVFTGLVTSLPFLFFKPELGVMRAVAQGIALVTTAGGDFYLGQDTLPSSFQVWRGIAAWIGGFASIIMVLALYTQINHGGMQLHRTPLVFGQARPGMSRIYSLSRAIFPLYVSVTSILVLALYATGTELAKALLFAAGAISGTGLSVGSLDPGIAPATLVILSGGMIAALANWDTLLAAIIGTRTARRYDPEFLVILLIAIVAACAVMIMVDDGLTRPYAALFLVSSALSGTGWVPEGIGVDHANVYESFTFLALAALGGAAASSSGGLKGVRLVALAQLGRRELDRLAYPNRAGQVRVFGSILENRDIDAIWLLVACSIFAAIAATLLFAMMGSSVIDAVHMAVTALSLSAPLMDFLSPEFVGFQNFSTAEQVLTALLNIIGRVEASVFMALFVGQLWRA